MSVVGLPITMEGLRRVLAVSRDSNEEFLGRMGQEHDLREWAEQHDVEIVGLVRERGVKRDQPLLLRPKLIAAVRRVEKGQADGLLFRDQERVGEFAEELLDALTYAGGRLVTCREGIMVPRQESEEARVIRLHETARIAEDRLRIRQRCEAGLKEKVKRGGYKGGNRLNRRYGYELVEDFPIAGHTNYRPIPHEQAVITRLIDAAPHWQWICDHLNYENIPGPTGNPWERSAALKIVRRETNIRNHTNHGLIALPNPTPHTTVDTVYAEATGDTGSV